MNLRQEKALAEKLSRIIQPQTAIILGTGLGDTLQQSMMVQESLAYHALEGFPRSTVSSHAGELILGQLGTSPVAVMSGRFHLYEGYSARQATFPIRLFALMGVKRLFIACAAGGLRPDMPAGSPMLITDHINLSGANPLTGPNDDELGQRFPHMVEPYSKTLALRAREIAAQKRMDLKEGVYAQVLGPSLETAAETRMLQRMGADAVGMSTAIETITAVHAGLEVLAIAAITNVNDPDNYEPAGMEEVISMARVAAPCLSDIFTALC